MSLRDRFEAQTPVYVINGFLDSGKSTFFTYTIGQPYFQTQGLTLIILCEEGEVPYPESLLKTARAKVEYIENEEDFTKRRLAELEAKYRPERILIEWNGMWNFKSFELPSKLRLEQQITCIDASTFGVYYSNLAMRSLLFEELRASEMVLFNRCDGMDFDTLVKYKRNVKAIAMQADLIFEDSNGEIDMTTEEDLPFDIHQDVIDLQGINYGIWYIDAMEHPDRYMNKQVRFTAIAGKPEDIPKNYFAPGRMVMTCCAQDIQFLGFPCYYEDSGKLKEGGWVDVTAAVSVSDFPMYDQPGIVLKAVDVKETKEPADAVINFAG